MKPLELLKMIKVKFYSRGPTKVPLISYSVPVYKSLDALSSFLHLNKFINTFLVKSEYFILY